MYRKNSSGWVKHVDFILLDLLYSACILFFLCVPDGRMESLQCTNISKYGNLYRTGRYSCYISV